MGVAMKCVMAFLLAGLCVGAWGCGSQEDDVNKPGTECYEDFDCDPGEICISRECEPDPAGPPAPATEPDAGSDGG